MPRKDSLRRVERGLYIAGKIHWACATSPGSRQAVGDVILMDQLGGQLRRRSLASRFSQETDLVVGTSTDRTIVHRNLTSRGLEKACARAGLVDVTFHALRHTFASLLIGQSHGPVFVSRQLGHANPAITFRVYAHLFDATRHAEQARNRLQAEYRHLLD